MELPRAIRRGRSRVETRPSTRAALACDVLEGRRLMTAGAAHAKADLARLARDGEVFHIDTRVSAAEINAVEADSTAIRAATTSLASPSATHALLADLSSGRAGIASNAEWARFEVDYQAILGSEGVSDPNLVNRAEIDQRAAITSAGLTTRQLAKLARDEHAAAADLGVTGSPTGLG